MAEKRKKVVLTIKEKLEVIDRFEKGETATKLSKEYGIGEQTVRDIKRNKSKLLEFLMISESGEGPSKRKSMKKSTYKELDTAMLEWFNEKRSEGISVSGPMCTQQAKLFHKELGLEGEFNASTGWLSRFKQRYGICEITVQRGRPSNDPPAVAEFCKEFQQFVSDERLGLEQIYNASETGLYWKGLPTNILSCDESKQTSGSKFNKERVTLVCCGNATGNHKLNLVVIGNMKKLPFSKESKVAEKSINYYYQKSSWMEPDIFGDWFHKKFVPQVQLYLRSKGIPPKAVLLLDNSPSHTINGKLSSEDGLIYVKYLPANVSSWIQPMNHNVIPSFKRHYRAELLKRVVNKDSSLMDLWAHTSLLNAVQCISHAWERVKPVTIERSWKRILVDMVIDEDEEFYDDLSNSELDALLSDVDGVENMMNKKLKEWLESDVCEPDCDNAHSTPKIVLARTLPDVMDVKKRKK